jgi:hypothetical protein
MFLWTNMELQVALICASIPALKVFFKHYKDASFRSTLNYSMGRYHNGTSKSGISEGTLKAPGFYTQQLSSDTKHDDQATGDGFITVHDTVTVTSAPVSSDKIPSLDKSAVSYFPSHPAGQV